MNHAASVFYRFLQQHALPRLRQRGNQLLGRQCFACGIRASQAICASCYGQITRPAICCRVCGLAMTGHSQDSRCKACIENPPAFHALYCAGNYQGLLAEAIVAAKIARQPAAIEALLLIQQRALSQLDASIFADYTVLPMPTPKLRLMQRGFNLPALLANQLAKQWQLTRLPDTVVKLPLSAPKQALMNAKQRQKHRHLYQISDKLPKKILLVDDIITTGQTLNSLAKATQQHGAQSLAVWVLARTQLKP
ncbi:MAG: hypothetical protein CSA45_06430 [Gammaproteobacteria bacterium]|nr:MAG: hypothetical protein CSA45_06430 [Gammaproteobacteria bacterium]